jgi:L-threonylcarbamoyladenylate synthase
MHIISNCTQEAINKAAQALIDGHLVAFPTETVYGLGANATNEKAVSQIYTVKGRPTDHPLIVHISSKNQISSWSVDVPEYALKLARDLWPGPLTLILPRSTLAKDFLTGGQNTIGLRVPDHQVALELLINFEKLGGKGIAAPSANRFGSVSPTTIEAVKDELGAYLDFNDLILNGGQSRVGIESTIIDCTSDTPLILRPGAITSEIILNKTGLKPLLDYNSKTTRTSGLFKSHYSPKARVILNQLPKQGEGFIAMADIPTPQHSVRLLAPENVEDFAKHLYVALRNGDHLSLDIIKVIEPKGGGIAESIRDRLIKSSEQKDI